VDLEGIGAFAGVVALPAKRLFFGLNSI